MIRAIAIAMLLGSIAVTGACGEDGNAGADVDAGAPDITNNFDEETIIVYGIPGPVDRASVRTPTEGIEVCLASHPAVPCVITDAEGVYRMPGVPADADITLTYRHADLYDGAIRTRSPYSGTAPHHALMLTDARADEILTLGGYTAPSPQLGMLLVVLFTDRSQRLPGASLIPAEGDSAVYLDAVAQPDLSLTSSPVGVSLLLGREPGEVEFSLVTPGYRCDLGEQNAIPTATPGTYRSTIFAGTMTTALFQCGEDQR